MGLGAEELDDVLSAARSSLLRLGPSADRGASTATKLDDESTSANIQLAEWISKMNVPIWMATFLGALIGFSADVLLVAWTAGLSFWETAPAGTIATHVRVLNGVEMGPVVRSSERPDIVASVLHHTVPVVLVLLVAHVVAYTTLLVAARNLPSSVRKEALGAAMPPVVSSLLFALGGALPALLLGFLFQSGRETSVLLAGIAAVVLAILVASMLTSDNYAQVVRKL